MLEVCPAFIPLSIDQTRDRDPCVCCVGLFLRTLPQPRVARFPSGRIFCQRCYLSSQPGHLFEERRFRLSLAMLDATIGPRTQEYVRRQRSPD